MKAAVCHAFGEPLVIEEVVLAPPGPGELRITLAACAICQSDVHFVNGAWGGQLPAVYGHEAAGVVAELGADVAGFAVGDHVVVTLIRSCGECPACLRSEPVLCATTFALDERSPLTALDGSPIAHGLRTAAFAEEVVVDASQAVVIPPEIPLDSASLLACGVITGFGAVVNTASVAPGDSVVVVGTGGVGINAIQGAATAGATPLVAVDLSEEKRQRALDLGATHGIDPREGDLEAAVAEITGGGADHVILTVGASAVVEQGPRLLRRGGTMVIVGMPATGVTAALDPGTIANDNIRILGSKMGSARIAVDIPHLISLYQCGRLVLDELISARYPLSEINDALATAGNDTTIRNVIVL